MAILTRSDNRERELDQDHVSIKSCFGALAHEDKMPIRFASLRRDYIGTVLYM
jgi:hypothetical protein